MRSPWQLRFLAQMALVPLLACNAPRSEEAAAGTETRAEAPAGAQSGGAAVRGDFEGVIRAVSHSEGERNDMVIHVKGDRWRMDMEMEGQRSALIRDGGGRTLTLVEGMRQYMYMPQLEGEDEPMQFTATGQSETVAGHRCQYYRITDPNDIQDGDQVCVTTDFGFVGFGAAGAYGAADERALRQQFRDGFFVLRSRDSQGNLEWEVTSIERTSVSDAQFAPPAGYTELQRPVMGAPPRP